MTSYNGPREIRVSSEDPKLKKDLDRLVADLVRAQPPVRRSVVRWQKSVPVSLDSTVICFVPSAGDTMVLPRPTPLDDGRTIIIAVATGSGILTVEAPRGPSASKLGESADIRTLDQPGAFTFTVIDGIYYVATAISGSIPPTIIQEAMEIEGPALVGRTSEDVGTTTEIALGNMLNFVGNTLEIIFSTGPALLGSGSGGSAGQVLVGPGLAFSSEATIFVTGVAPDQLEPGTAGVLGYTSTSSSTATVMHPSASGQAVMYDGTSVGWDTPTVADGSITAAKLASDAVTMVKILDGNVTADKLASDAVTTVKILNSNVTTTKIADLNVTNPKIAGEAVTRDKLNDFGRYLCAVTNTTDQSFTAASGDQTVNWFSEITDADAQHSTASNAGRISIPRAGLWEIAWSFLADQDGAVKFFLNGAQVSDNYPVTAGVVQTICLKRNLSETGVLEMCFNIDVNGTSDGPSCNLTVTSLAF